MMKKQFSVPSFTLIKIETPDIMAENESSVLYMDESVKKW